MNDSNTRDRWRTPVGIALAGLAMSFGWGFRGDYGHEAGAMVPGALVGLAICLASGREDWWRRAPIIGMLGAIGWAFGGQMSYGRIVGYTAGSSLPDVAYGYGCLFLIGALWAGIGSAILALGITEAGSWLRRSVGPLVVLWLVWFVMYATGLTEWLVDKWYAHDTDWVGALSALLVVGVYAAVAPRARPICGLIAMLAAGWWAGYVLLTIVLGLRMTPPRSDNWAGCVGLFVALILYLAHRKNRAAIKMAAWGFLVGGLGFALGDFANMLGRAQWGPIGRYEALQGLDYWKWMEQGFGLIMGIGVGAAFLGCLRPRLSRPNDDDRSGALTGVALTFLLVVMLWSNLFKNVRNWAEAQHIPEQVLGVDARWWFMLVGVMLTAMVVLAIARHLQGKLPFAPTNPLGRTQLLLLVILWIAALGALLQAFPGISSKGVFFVHATFWITAAACSLIVLSLASKPGPAPSPAIAASDASWKLSWKYWLCCLLVPVLVLVLTYLTVSCHDEPLPGSHLRFEHSNSEVTK